MDANGHRTSNLYDARAMVQAAQDPLGALTSYTFDGAGNTVLRVDAQFGYFRDTANRLAVREDNSHGCSGDGWSTVAWAWYCSLTGGRVWTVDISIGAMEACRRRRAGYAADIESPDGPSGEIRESLTRRADR